MAIFILIVIFAVILWYAMAGRAWLKTKPWAAGFFAKIEPLEIALYRKSETFLVGRIVALFGFIVTSYDSFAIAFQSLDLTPLTTRIFDFFHVPPDLRGIAGTGFIAGLGMLITWMRKRQTRPIELVALPDKVVAENPKVAQAIEVADIAKDQAVVAAADVKAV